MMRWDGQPGSHNFQLLSEHNVSPCSATFPNARRNSYQEDLNSFLPRELEETTRTPSYYVDENYLARPGIEQYLREWSNWRVVIVHSRDWCATHSWWCMPEKKKEEEDSMLRTYQTLIAQTVDWAGRCDWTNQPCLESWDSTALCRCDCSSVDESGRVWRSRQSSCMLCSSAPWSSVTGTYRKSRCFWCCHVFTVDFTLLLDCRSL